MTNFASFIFISVGVHVCLGWWIWVSVGGYEIAELINTRTYITDTQWHFLVKSVLIYPPRTSCAICIWDSSQSVCPPHPPYCPYRQSLFHLPTLLLSPPAPALTSARLDFLVLIKTWTYPKGYPKVWQIPLLLIRTTLDPLLSIFNLYMKAVRPGPGNRSLDLSTIIRACIWNISTQDPLLKVRAVIREVERTRCTLGAYPERIITTL